MAAGPAVRGVGLREGPGLPAPRELLPCRSATLHVPSGRLLPRTPNLFNVGAPEFDHDPDPEPCERRTRFLEQLWGDDLEPVHLLQEWFGYHLADDTGRHQMLLMVGPRRSGKGTIGRVPRALVGVGNVAGPTTGSFADTFGLQSQICKSLAIVPDAPLRRRERLGRDRAAAVRQRRGHADRRPQVLGSA